MFALDNKSLHSIILVLQRKVGKVKIDIGQRETEICPVESPSGGGSPNYERRAEQQRLDPWWPRAQPLYWREPGGHHASPWQHAIITIIYVQPSPSNAQTPAILHSSIFLQDSARSFSNPGSLFDCSVPQLLFSVAKPLDAKWEAAGLIRMICRDGSINNVAYQFTARMLILSPLL